MLPAYEFESVRFHPLDFIKQADIRLTKGRWAGQAFEPRKWQADILKDAFREKDGRRIHTWGLIGMPRKNGKTMLGALAGLVLAFGDGEYGAEVYMAAGDKDQARLVFKAISQMVLFSSVFGPRAESGLLKVYRDSIYDPATDSVIRVVSSDAPLKHGLNPSGVIFDEIWNQPNDDLWEALTTGGGTREEPLYLALTTAGYDRDTLAYRLYERGKGEKDPHFYFYWRGLPEESSLDYRSRKARKMANPALDDFLKDEFLAAAAGKPGEPGRLLENQYRRLHLNQWTSAAALWISSEVWDACSAPPEIEDGADVWVAVSGISTRKEAAVAWAARGDGVDVKVQRFTPDEDVVSTDDLMEKVRDLAKRYEIRRVSHTSLFNLDLHPKLEDEGFEVVEIPSNSKVRKGHYSQALYDAVIAGTLRHGGDGVLRAEAMAAMAVQEEDYFVLKPMGSSTPIEALRAAAMAVEAATEGEDSGTPGIIVVDFGGKGD